MYWFLSLAAALCYTLGAVCMKSSQGLTRPGPGAGVFICFLGGAALQAISMRHAALSVAYLFVLGVEAILAFTFGVVLFGESASLTKLAGVTLIVAGIALLHRDELRPNPSSSVNAKPQSHEK